MTRSAGRFLLRNALLVMGLLYLALAAMPATFWYNPGALDIPDVIEGQPIGILHTGGPVREFTGTYAVVVRDFETNRVVCDSRGGPLQFFPRSERPGQVTMEWWAPGDARCHRLPVGTYLVRTCWRIEGSLWGLVPSKLTCVPPEAFNVTPKPIVPDLEPGGE